MIGEIPALQIISAAVTPVVMISACGTLTISVNSRQQHLSDKIRSAAAESRKATVSKERRAQLHEQLGIFSTRFLCSWFAAGALYIAIVCFGVTTLEILLTQRGLSRSEPYVLWCFLTGLTFMLLAALCVVVEVSLSWRTMRLEMRDLNLPLRRPHLFHQRPDSTPPDDTN